MTGVARHRQVSADGHSAELLVPPMPPALAAHVAGWSEYTEYAPGTLRRLEPPGTGVTVILTFGPGLSVDHPDDPGGAREVSASFVAPLHLRPVDTAYAGDQHGIQLRLRPLGAAGLIGVPLSALRGVVPLDELADKWWARLAERLAAKRRWADRFDLLAGALLDRLGQIAMPDPLVARAWHQLERTHGAARVAGVAERLGCSRTYLAERFTAEIGVPPKSVARLLRFERASRLLREAPPGTGLARIAAAAGYYDHAHMVREFRDLAGRVPGGYLAQTSWPAWESVG